MNALKHIHHPDSIVLGNHEVHNIKAIDGINDLPAGLAGEHLLTLQLPSISITVGGIVVGARDFYICYSPHELILFIVETEEGRGVETKYRPQYGRGGNYDIQKAVQRIVWIYRPDSPRAQEPQIAKHLKEYLP